MKTAWLDVAVEVLPQALFLIPAAYRIAGSHESPHEGVVRLRLTSSDAHAHAGELRCEVMEGTSTRHVAITPAADRN